MIPTRTFRVLVALGATTVAAAPAQTARPNEPDRTSPREDSDRRPLREARSANEHFALRLSPGRPGGGRRCRARFSMSAERGHRERPLWSGRLVNPVAPVVAQIPDDGRRLVTLDDFRRGGVQNALVVYDERGRELRVFGLKELLLANDWPHVRVRDDAVIWLADAEFSFENVSDTFVVRLAWGREIRIDLRRTELIGDKPGEADLAAIPSEVAEQLDSPVASAAASVTREALLEQFARMRASISPGDMEALAVLKAQFRELMSALEAAERQPEDAEAQAALQELAAAFGMENADLPEDFGEATFEPDWLEPSAAAAPTDSIPPAPNPDDYVDYLAWANQFTHVDGPSAAPLYEALDGALIDPVDPEFGRVIADAAAGLPEALADPRTAEYIAENAGAVALLDAATQYPYEGWTLQSADGMMIGALLPNLSAVRAVTRVAVAEGRLMVADGRTADALDRYAGVFENAAQTGRGVTLIERLVGVSVGALAAEASLDALALDDGSVDYAAVADRLEEADRPMRPVPEIMQFERAMVLDLMQRSFERGPGGELVATPERLHYLDYTSGESEPGPDQVKGASELNALGFEGTVTKLQSYYDRMDGAMTQPAAAAIQALKGVEEELGVESSAGGPPLGLIPAVSQVTYATARGDASRRAATTVARIKAYQQQFGQLPDSLESVGISQSMIDPFSGQPFVYARVGDDFVLYSVGENGVDEGGESTRFRDSPDLRFWPRPVREPN